MHRVRVNAVVAVVLLLAFNVSAAQSAPVPPDSTFEQASQATEDWAIVFRQRHGFDAAPDLVRRYEADETLDRTYGVALTDAEVSEMRRRDRILDAMGPLTDLLVVDPNFGGIYLDQRAGGVVDVASVRGLSVTDEQMKGLLPPGTSLRERLVDHTFAELRRTADLVGDDLPRLRGQGRSPVASYVDVVRNTVVLELENPTRDDVEFASATYGSAVEVIRGVPESTAACVLRSNCASPMKGGLAISSNGYTCTSGFMSRPLGSFSTLWVMTAGHCIFDAGLGRRGVITASRWASASFTSTHKIRLRTSGR